MLLLILAISFSTAWRSDGAEILPISASTTGNYKDGRPPCSLNGQLDEDQGICHCDKPWSGTECEILQFLPLSIPNGYPNLHTKTTWGGDIVYNAHDKTHHLFVTAMTDGCSLRSWQTHSRIEHAISHTGITGPYEFVDVAVPIWSHNPKVIALQQQNQKTNGSFASSSAPSLALFHIGMGAGPADLHKNCTKQDYYSIWQRRGHSDDDGGKDDASTKASRNLFQDQKNSASTIGTRAARSGTIHTAPSVQGPWTPLPNNTLGYCNNPAPFVVHDRTKGVSIIYIVCDHNVLKQAHNVGGPWTTIGEIIPSENNDGSITNDDAGGGIMYEDPSLYVDHRGHFHVIFHAYVPYENPPHGHDCSNSTVAAHFFSVDGRQWYRSPGQPYGSQIQLLEETATAAGGGGGGHGRSTIMTLSTRERPTLIFDTDPVTGRVQQLTHLLTGACSAPNCPRGPPAGCVNCKYDHWDYTLIQAFDI